MKGVSNAFRGLADILEAIETNGTDETEVDISSVTPLSQDILTSETIRTELEVRVPLFDSEPTDRDTKLSAEDVQLTDDGSLLVGFRIAVSPDEQTNGEFSTSKPQLENGDSSGSKSEELYSGDPGYSECETDTTSSSPTDGKGEVPAYRDPDQLREVYERYDTFAEMTDALGVDVTPQTVRRYMIKHRIHQPSSNTNSKTVEKLLEADPDTLSSSKGESDSAPVDTDDEDNERPTRSQTESSLPAVTEGEPEARKNTAATSESDRPQVTDGGQRGSGLTAERRTGNSTHDRVHGESHSTEGTTTEDGLNESHVALPDNVDIEEITEIVRDSRTLYEVQRQLDREREEVRALLRDLNLIDLVHGRLATQRLEDHTLDEIDQRIRSSTQSS